MKLAERLRAARLAAGFESKELDALAGLAEGHVRKIEAGEIQSPTIATVLRLAKALGIKAADLVGQ